MSRVLCSVLYWWNGPLLVGVHDGCLDFCMFEVTTLQDGEGFGSKEIDVLCPPSWSTNFERRTLKRYSEDSP